MKKAKLDWIIHHVANGAICAKCGEVENSYPPYICDSHTHGLDKYDGHLEFQIVVNYGMEENMRLLNTLGLRVQDGERFKSGDFVKGLYLDCDILLKELPDCNGRPVLRLVIPDDANNLPDKATYPHSLQYLGINELLAYYRCVHESGFSLCGESEKCNGQSSKKESDRRKS